MKRFIIKQNGIRIGFFRTRDEAENGLRFVNGIIIEQEV